MPIGKPAQPGGERGVLRRGDDEEGVGELLLAQILRIVDAPHFGPGFSQRGALFRRPRDRRPRR